MRRKSTIHNGYATNSLQTKFKKHSTYLLHLVATLVHIQPSGSRETGARDGGQHLLHRVSLCSLVCGRGTGWFVGHGLRGGTSQGQSNWKEKNRQIKSDNENTDEKFTLDNLKQKGNRYSSQHYTSSHKTSKCSLTHVSFSIIVLIKARGVDAREELNRCRGRCDLVRQ